MAVDAVSSCDFELWSVTLTVELDLDRGKVTQRTKYLDQRSFPFKSHRPDGQTERHRRTYTQPTECSMQTTKVVGKEYECLPVVVWLGWVLCGAGCCSWALVDEDGGTADRSADSCCCIRSSLCLCVVAWSSCARRSTLASLRWRGCCCCWCDVWRVSADDVWVV